MLREDAGTEDPRDASTDAGPAPVEPLAVSPQFDADFDGDRSSIVTTLSETLQPRYVGDYLDELGRMRVPPEEFGALHPQPGEPFSLRAQLPGAAPDWMPGALPSSARSVHFSFIIADVQLVDQESPALVPSNLQLAPTAFRPHGEWAAALADSLLRSVSAFHEQRPLDMVFSLGDQIEDAQLNELRWFLTLFEGGELSVDSGERDDMVSGPGNDAYDPFVAAGLPEDLPWVGVIGNHDVLVNGIFPVGLIRESNEDADARAALEDLLTTFGGALPGISVAGAHPAYYANEARPAFTITPETFEPSLLPLEPLGLESHAIPKDPDRAHVDSCEIMDQFRNARGLPAGHGYSDSMIADCLAMQEFDPTAPAGGWFTLDLVPDALRLIALSLGPVAGGPSGILARPPDDCVVMGQPCRDDPRFDQVAFLESELDRAAADDVEVIVMSHQVSEELVTEPALELFALFLSEDPAVGPLWQRWVPELNEAMTPLDFRKLLATNGHVIAHIAGHDHRHEVRAVCPDGTTIENATDECESGDGSTGYWEVTTSAVVDPPHQGRFMEIVHVEGQLGALYLTVQDPRMPADSLAERGRFLGRAWVAAQTNRFAVDGSATGAAPGPKDRNLLLPFSLPKAVADKWTDADFESELASETVLTKPAGKMPSLPVWVK